MYQKLDDQQVTPEYGLLFGRMLTITGWPIDVAVPETDPANIDMRAVAVLSRVSRRGTLSAGR